jgi:C-terminal processing protease CtpA/Prc
MKQRKGTRSLLGVILLVFGLTGEMTSIPAQAQQEGSVGILLDYDPQSPQEILVYAVTYKSPADKAGIKRGEKLLKVDGTAVTGLKLEEIATKIRGPVGATLTLTLQSLQGEVRDIPLVRAVVAQGPKIAVPPPSKFTQGVTLSDQDKALIKAKILGLSTDEQRQKMLQLLTALKEKRITKEKFLTILNTEF